MHTAKIYYFFSNLGGMQYQSFLKKRFDIASNGGSALLGLSSGARGVLAQVSVCKLGGFDMIRKF